MSISGDWRSVVCRRNNHDRKPVLPRGGERKHLVRATFPRVNQDSTGPHVGISVARTIASFSPCPAISASILARE